MKIIGQLFIGSALLLVIIAILINHYFLHLLKIGFLQDFLFFITKFLVNIGWGASFIALLLAIPLSVIGFGIIFLSRK
ncbi:uncharacterized protein METZ01_LOCUS449172 [marine metagenome]|uniref:Uncharacterized protein n=1 Tax=marine metagenome TaxID=408172 RepID=A0A382ZNR8_9ZZZZ